MNAATSRLLLMLLALPSLATAQDQPVLHVSGRSAPFHACVAQGGTHAASYWVGEGSDAIVLFDLETRRDYATVNTDGGIYHAYFAAGGTRLVAVTERAFEVHDLAGNRLSSWRHPLDESQDTRDDEAMGFVMATHAPVEARTVRHSGKTKLLIRRPEGTVSIDEPGNYVYLSASGNRAWWCKGRKYFVADTRSGSVRNAFDIAATEASRGVDLPAKLLAMARDDKTIVLPSIAARDGEEFVSTLRWFDGDQMVAEWQAPPDATEVSYFFAADGALAIDVTPGEGSAAMLRWQPREGAPTPVDWPRYRPESIDFDSGIAVSVPMPGESLDQLTIVSMAPQRVIGMISSSLAHCTWLVDRVSGDLCDFHEHVLRKWDLGIGRRDRVATSWNDSIVATAGGVVLTRGLGGTLVLSNPDKASEIEFEPIEMQGLDDQTQVAVDAEMRRVAVATHDTFWTARIRGDRFVDERSWPRPGRPEGATEPVKGALRCAHLREDTWCVVDDLGRVEIWTSDGSCRQAGAFSELVAPETDRTQSVASCFGLTDGVLIWANGRIFRLDPDSRSLKSVWQQDQRIDACAVAPDGSIAVGCGEEILLLDADLTPKTRLASPHDSWRELHFARGGTQLVCSMISIARLWKLPGGEGPFTLAPMHDGTAAIVAPSGHWSAPRSALSALTLRLGSRGYPAEAFDATQNRPDLVLAQLGIAEAPAIERAGQRVRARWTELGLRPDAAQSSASPTVAWAQRPPRATAEAEVTLRVKANAGSSPLRRWRALVDNVPIEGIGGRPTANGTSEETQFVVPLRHGDNQIQIDAIDENGTRSLPLHHSVLREGQAPSPRLFVLGIGVSKYRDESHDLRYAASDALRLCEQMKASWPGECQTFTLLDQAADRGSTLSAASFLQQASVDDVALVFLAGHGLVADGAGYVFAAHDTDFANPAATGVRLAEIEALVHSTPARRRIVLLDTCRAGRPKPEVSSQIALKPPAANADGAPAAGKSGELPAESGPTARLLTRGIDPDMPSQAAGAFEDPMDALSDLGDGVGATMLAASGGAEYALEIGAMRGGLFTTAVCDGLSLLSADRDKDLSITLREWAKAAQDNVVAWSKGAQAPGLRRDNLQFDVVLARATPARAMGEPLEDFEVKEWSVSEDGKSVLMLGQQGALLRSVTDGVVRWRAAGPEEGHHGGALLMDGTVALQSGSPELSFLDPQDGHLLATSDVFCLMPRGLDSQGAGASVFLQALEGQHWDIWQDGKIRRVELASSFAQRTRVVDILLDQQGSDARLLGMYGEVIRWRRADDSQESVGQLQRPEGVAPTGEIFARQFSDDGHYVLGSREAEGETRLFVWDAKDGKLLSDRRVQAGRTAVVLPDGIAEIHVGDREVGKDPLQVLDPIQDSTKLARWLPDRDREVLWNEPPYAWMQRMGTRGLVFVRVEADAVGSKESMLVFDAHSETRMGWLSMDCSGAGAEDFASNVSWGDLVGTARFVAARDVVVWVDRSGRVYEWPLATR